jgi:negative regulator of flagellin synthesis FlgM
MKVGSPADKPPVAPVATGRAAPAEPQARQAPVAPAAAAVESSAQVELSSTAAALLSGAGGASAEFDAEKVARISQAIEAGTFKVNADVIADKLIANAQELLNQSSH